MPRTLLSAIGESLPAKRARCSILLLVGLLALTTACAPFHPMSRSKASIRNRVLELTPLGSSEADVRSSYETQFAPNCRWQKLSPRGYLPQHPLRESLGAHAGLQGCIGSYWNLMRGPFTTYVFVRWVFDDRGELVEVEVEKDVDVL